MKQKLLNKLWLRVGMIVAIMTTALSGTVKAADETITFSTLKLSNGVQYETINGTDCILTFGDGSNDGKYYTTGAAIRVYGGGHMTVSSTKTITKIELTFGTGDGSNTITTDIGTYSNGTWTGSASSITFTVGGSSGHRRIASVAVTYAGGTPTPTTYTVTYDANGGTGTMTDTNSPYEEDDVVTLLTNTFTAPEGKVWDSWLVKDASNSTISVSNNQFTMPASNVTVTAQWVNDPNAPQYEWVLTDWSDLQEGDIFVIVGNGTKAMDNSVVSSNPSALAVTTQNGKITSTVTNAMMWNRSAVEGGYKLLPNGSTTNWLNNPTSTDLRVDTKTANSTFTYVTYSSNNYLKVGSRYVCIKSNSDWRAYAEQNVSSNATNTTFYRRQVVSTDPTIEASNVSINYDATGGNIDFTVNNEVSGGELTAAVLSGGTIDNLTIGTITSSTVPFTCDANTMTTEKSATIRLTYTFNTNESVSMDVKITQAAYVAPPTGDQYALFSGELVEGDYIIYYGGKAMNTTVTNDRLQYEEVTPESNVITTDDATIVWHIAPSGDYWTIFNAAANAYAASTGAKNKAQLLADETDDMVLWTVSGKETYEFVNKNNTDNNVNANLRNNGTFGFACYATSTGGALTLYKKVVPTESVTLNAYGYATFSSNNAVSIPENGDFTAWQITNIDGDNKITFVQVIGNVKAETGLFLKGTASDEITIEVAASGEELSGNRLVGFPNATNVTAGEYYGLSGSQFVKVNAGTVKAGKALLPAGLVTEDSGNVKAFTFVFEDDATGINEELRIKNEESSIYNLAGQMVNGKSVNGKLPKGIYIVNGKKIAVK